MTGAWDRLATMFAEALDQPVEQRAAFVKRRCGDDTHLRDELLDMLETHDDDRALSIESRLGETADLPAREDLSGTRIGAFELEALVGGGGMGEVYRARRVDGVFEQCVAIKVVSQGPRANELLRRFRQERSILARLQHPNIARLIDGGQLEDGRPYLAMEYIEGDAIDTYCDAQQLGVKERLRIFLSVCRAVQSAHEQLILHRDLKPSNILVDAQGEPHLLDFGIAKLLDSSEEEGELTRAIDRVLTPEHAAPEQIRGESVSVTADVYALGVLLYLLMTGSKPREFPSPYSVDMVRRLEDSDPRPASEVDLDFETARRRGCRPAELRRQLRGDLDTILGKALRGESERRYSSVESMATDLELHLEGLPIRARRDNLRYRAGKFVRRNRALVGGVATVVLLLLAFGTVSRWQAGQISRQRDRAEGQRQRSEEVLTMLVDLFEQATPEKGTDFESAEVERMLQRGEDLAAQLSPRDPTRSRLFETLGSIREKRAELDEASRLYALAYESASDSLDRLRVNHMRAMLTARREGPDAARAAIRSSYEHHRNLLGERNLDTVQAMADLAAVESAPEDRLRLARRALELRRELAPDDELAVASSLHRLGGIEAGAGDYVSAARDLAEASSMFAKHLDEDHPRRLVVEQDLSVVLARQGNWTEAEAVQRRVLATKRRLYGDDADVVAGAWQSLGVTLANLGRIAEASEAFEACLRAYRATLAPDHWRIANAARNVGQLLALQERWSEATDYFDEALGINERIGAPEQAMLYMRGQRAMVTLGAGQTATALSELEEVAATLERLDDARRDYRADSQIWLGCARLRAEDNPGAQRAFEVATGLRQEIFADDHPKVAEARCGWAVAELRSSTGESAAAQQRLEQALPVYEAWGLRHPILLAEARAVASH